MPAMHTDQPAGPATLHSRYLSLFEQASDAIMLTDFSGNFINANESFCKMFGYSKAEVLTMHISAFIVPEDLAASPIKFGLLKEGRQIFSQRKMVHRDGHIIYVEVNVKKCDEECVMAIARDVTEKKHALDALEKEKFLSDSIINSLPGIFFLRYVAGPFIRWNKNMETALGYSHEELAALPFLGLIATKDKEMILSKIQEVMKGGVGQAEACIVKRNGEEVPYYFTAISLEYDNKPALMGTAMDISQRIHAEKMLAEERARRQQEVTDAVITGIENERQAIGRELHDHINQLLAGALMYLRLFQETQHRKEPLLDEAGTQVLNAINDIRSLSHSMISPFLDEQPFAEALEKIVSVVRKSGVNIDINLQHFNDSKLDPKLKITLFRIIQEQFSNILKHASAKKITLCLKQHQKKLLLSIKDDGVGFTPGAKTDGIGIINIRTRASLFNGVTNIISEPGKGTELTVTIPA